MTRQRSKGKGSHGAKATHEVHGNCCHCLTHVPLSQLNSDHLCRSCFRRHYPNGSWTSGTANR